MSDGTGKTHSRNGLGAWLLSATLLVAISSIPSMASAQMAEGFAEGSHPAPPPAEQIEAGKRVYYTKCVWCHGVEGAGDGPGADRLWPRPRNFNGGTFKIRHTASGQLPLIDVDLFQTVTHGLPG
ncbi:MAG: c-type cytochrome, partial [Nitrospira sp.]|nr:c-type cytochrome [Nitrospira sp.]